MVVKEDAPKPEVKTGFESQACWLGSVIPGRSCLYNVFWFVLMSQVWWHMSLVLAAWKAEV